MSARLTVFEEQSSAVKNSAASALRLGLELRPGQDKFTLTFLVLYMLGGAQSVRCGLRVKVSRWPMARFQDSFS